MGFLELKRFQGWKETGTSGFLNAFPFDPAGERARAGWSAMCVAGTERARVQAARRCCCDLPIAAAAILALPQLRLASYCVPLPAGMNSPSMATKEVKNGRLAMTAFVGFAVQVRGWKEGD